MNIDELRAQFPVTKHYTYLNHAAVAPLPQSVINAVYEVTQEKGDSGGLHWMDWEEEAEKTRNAIAGLINATPEEIAFVPNTSEGLSIIANGLKWNKNDNIVTNDLEFPSVAFPWQIQAKKHGLELRIVRNRNEALFLEDFEDKIDRNTKVVAISHVQFSNGFKIDLKRLSHLAHENNAYIIIDGVQGVGQTPVDVKQLDVDFYTSSGYKWLLSPVATGFLFLKRELIEEIDPTFVGYRSDELEHEFHFREISPTKSARRFEHGQLNFPGIAGMQVAIALLEKIGVHNIENRIRVLMDYLIAGIEEIRELKVISSLTPEHRSGIIKVKIENSDIDPEEIITQLQEQHIIISSRAGGLRISCNFYNTEEEIKRLLDALSLLTQS